MHRSQLSREGGEGLSAAVQFEDVLLCCEVVGTEQDAGRAVLGGRVRSGRCCTRWRRSPAQRKVLLSELDELQTRVAAQRQEEMARLKQPARPAQGGRPSPWRLGSARVCCAKTVACPKAESFL
ncbi:hypothetical protein DIPPA_28850 [Diplonema papillatum]|nr:hypothetical protein DIPPA_28850 [Diplonema papillatum]